MVVVVVMMTVTDSVEGKGGYGRDDCCEGGDGHDDLMMVRMVVMVKGKVGRLWR